MSLPRDVKWTQKLTAFKVPEVSPAPIKSISNFQLRIPFERKIKCVYKKRPWSPLTRLMPPINVPGMNGRLFIALPPIDVIQT